MIFLLRKKLIWKPINEFAYIKWDADSVQIVKEFSKYYFDNSKLHLLPLNHKSLIVPFFFFLFAKLILLFSFFRPFADILSRSRFPTNQYRSTAARVHIYRDRQSSMGNEEPSEKLIQQRDKREGSNGIEYRTGAGEEMEATELEWGCHRGSSQTEGRESV